MSWGSSFVASLDSPSKSIEYALRFIGHSNDYFLGTARTIGNGGLISLGAAQVTIDNARVTPQRWSVNFGGFSIEIVGDLRPISTSAFRKGAIAELFMSRNRGQPERVAIGQLRSLTGGRGVWRLEFGDLISAMTSRLSTKAEELSFYYNAGTTTTVATNFNFSSSNQLQLADISSFEKDANFDGMAFVTNAAGSSAYYTWSSKVTTSAPAGYLVITSTGSWPSTGQIPTLQSGDKVMAVTRLQGRPDEVFARTLMSTGNATQGPFDDFPKAWGVGINFISSLINSQDMNLWYNNVWKTATGNHHIQIVISSPQDSGIRNLINSTLELGMWPVFRQGRISWRVCQDPEAAVAVSIAESIRDRDIIQIESHSIYSPSQSVVHGKSSILTSNSSGVEAIQALSVTNVRALPANNEIQRDNRFIYRIDTPAQSSKASKDLGRMSAWDLYTYEELSLAVSERFAGLVAGDIVAITSSMIYGYKEAAGKTYLARRGMILGNRWLPNQSRCILSIGVISK